MKTQTKLVNCGWALAVLGVIVFFHPVSQAATVNVSGHIESTYMYDFNDPNTQTTALRTYDGTANSFYLNAAHVAVSGELEDGVGYVVEVDHGRDAGIGNNQNPGIQTDIQEAYLTFPLGPFSLTAGKFVTYEGIEVIEGPSNPTISRGYLYGLAEAFGHVGAKAHIGLGEKFDVGLGLVNGRDQDVDANEGKTVIGRIGFDSGGKFAVGLSGSHGAAGADDTTTLTHDESNDNITSVDLTGSLKVIPKFPILFQVLWAEMDRAKTGTNNSGHWSGAGIQPTWEICEKFVIGMRVEYFDDLDRGNFTATNYTVTPTYKMNESVMIRAELRRDIVHSTTGPGPFVDDKGMSLGTATTASAGFSYLFGS